MMLCFYPPIRRGVGIEDDAYLSSIILYKFASHRLSKRTPSVAALLATGGEQSTIDCRLIIDNRLVVA